MSVRNFAHRGHHRREANYRAQEQPGGDHQEGHKEHCTVDSLGEADGEVYDLESLTLDTVSEDEDTPQTLQMSIRREEPGIIAWCQQLCFART